MTCQCVSSRTCVPCLEKARQARILVKLGVPWLNGKRVKA